MSKQVNDMTKPNKTHRWSPLSALLLAGLALVLAAAPARAEVCAPFRNVDMDPQVYEAMMEAASQNRLYRFGGTASRVSFCVDRALADPVNGSFGEFYGGLAMPLEAREEGQVVLLVRANSLSTGDRFLDTMARGESFFDTEDYPDILFVSREIEWTSPTEAKLFGDLTLHGKTRPITFEVMLTDIEGDDPEHEGHFHLQATTTVKRSEFNMNSFPVMLSDTVRLCIEFEADLVRDETREPSLPTLTRKDS